MPDLRRALEEAGFGTVRTYLQSGNLVVSSRKALPRVARDCEHVIADRFGADVRVVARTRDELADVVQRNPLRRVATDPKRYQVTFLAEPVDGDVIGKLEAVTVPPERFVVSGREIYAWHPASIARSKLWALLAGPKLGVTATARNWSTVTTLGALANESA
jgi:uncharacterized protein (DUF1697 family)